jgi:hypothetical protein
MAKQKWRKFARELGRKRKLSWKPGTKRKEFNKIMAQYRHLQEKEFLDLRDLARDLAKKQDVPYKMLLVGIAALVRQSFRGRSKLIVHDSAQIRQNVSSIAEALAEKTSDSPKSRNWFQMDQTILMNMLWNILLLYPIAQQTWWKKHRP